MDRTNITLRDLQAMVEEIDPQISADIDAAQNQIVVSFRMRPKIQVNLLTPWYQNALRKNNLSLVEVQDLLMSIQHIAQNT